MAAKKTAAGKTGAADTQQRHGVVRAATWLADNVMELLFWGVIIDSFYFSFMHMMELAQQHNQHGAQIPVSAGICDVAAILLAREIRIDKRIGRKRRGLISFPSLFLFVYIAGTLAANLATMPKNPGFWDFFFAILGPFTVAVFVILLERRAAERYRRRQVHEAAAEAAGTGSGAGTGTPGTGAGTGGKGGTGTASTGAEGAADDDSGTGGAGPEPARPFKLTPVPTPPPGYFLSDFGFIPENMTLPKGDYTECEELAHISVVRERFTAGNPPGTNFTADVVRVACKKGRPWAVERLRKLREQDEAARTTAVAVRQG